MKSIHLHKKSQFTAPKVFIPGSKSESNRALIIAALANGGTITNLATARDTQTMARLLKSDDQTLDVLDAGTTMRFLTAYTAVTNQVKVLTGTKRMQERPIKILVDALREIGSEIAYEREDGYPPIRIQGFSSQKSDRVQVPGHVSSQYISALLMIAPILEQGLSVELTGEVGSRPYIQMTLNIMKTFGASYNWDSNVISIPSQPYQPATFHVEPDWSGASYWYAFATLADHDGILLPGLKSDSLQGDRMVANLMASLGVTTTFTEEGAVLAKSEIVKEVSIDFVDCPDLAQTIAVICAACQVRGKFTGLESLKIKETDRIAALQNELAKLGASFEEHGDHYILTPPKSLPDQVHIETYEDHRMAMAFAPLAALMDVTINDPEVVEKSYPEFWDQVQSAGYRIT